MTERFVIFCTYQRLHQRALSYLQVWNWRALVPYLEKLNLPFCGGVTSVVKSLSIILAVAAFDAVHMILEAYQPSRRSTPREVEDREIRVGEIRSQADSRLGLRRMLSLPWWAQHFLPQRNTMICFS